MVIKETEFGAYRDAIQAYGNNPTKYFQVMEHKPGDKGALTAMQSLKDLKEVWEQVYDPGLKDDVVKVARHIQKGYSDKYERRVWRICKLWHAIKARFGFSTPKGEVANLVEQIEKVTKMVKKPEKPEKPPEPKKPPEATLTQYEKTIHGVRVILKMTNLVEEEVDAIVNAANATNIGGGGVDGAVHTACGPGLATECRKFARVNGDWCPTGTVRVTGAHGLTKVKHVIHTAGPVGEKPDLLANCYREAIKAANENTLTSIAFPSISTGIFGYPLESAAKTAIETVADELKNPGTLREVRWCFLNSRRGFDAYKKALDSQG